MEQNADVRDKNMERLVHGWPQKLGIADKYWSYKTWIFDTLLELQHDWDGQQGRDSTVKIRINLMEPSTRSVHSASYHAGTEIREFKKPEIDIMFNENMIEPEQRERASLSVLASKKDGTSWFCVDYQNLNAVTDRNSYAIAWIDKYIVSLSNGTIFSLLDRNSGYWQIDSDEADSGKNAFTIRHELYQLFECRLEFPVTFQRAMNAILSAVKWNFDLVYLGDILVFFKPPEEHIVHVCSVLTLYSNANGILKLRKCRHFAETIDYLGHVTNQKRLEAASHTTSATHKFQPPTSFTNSDLCWDYNVFEQLVPGFAEIAAPLNKRLRKNYQKVFLHLSKPNCSY